MEPQSLAEPHATPPPAPGLSPAQPHWHHHPPAVGSYTQATGQVRAAFMSFNFVAARFTGDFVQLNNLTMNLFSRHLWEGAYFKLG